MSDSKKCSTCGVVKNLTKFYFKNKVKGEYHSQCKLCFNATKQKYDEKNKNKISESKKEYYLENKVDILEKRKAYGLNYKEEKQLYNATYYTKNKTEINKNAQIRRKNRKQNDPAYKLREDISTIIRRAMKKNGGSKYGNSVLKHLTYSIQELKENLEKQFEPWMTWDNHGVYCRDIFDINQISTWTWQIDHIIPQASLPYITMTDDNFQKCWALSNLRPLRSDINQYDGVTKKRHKR